MSVGFDSPTVLCSHSVFDPRGQGQRDWGPDQTDQPPIEPVCFREILACVDCSELASGIVPHAQLMAKALGARLTLLHVLESEPAAGGVPPDPLDWGIRQREARAHLESLAAPLVELESDIRAELIHGSPAEQICAWAEQQGVDLTVLCSHGARGITDWDLASTARKLIDRIPGSLLLVPAKASAKGQEVLYRRILVPLDGSPRAESAVPIAERIANSQNAELVFGLVVPVPQISHIGPLDAEGADLERRVIEHNRRVADDYADRLRARSNRAGSRVRVIVIGDGTAQAGLERLIREQDIDLVVMSAHGHTCRTDCPCGSVTEYALTHATAPLLVVREQALCRARRVVPSRARPLERLAISGHSTS